MKNKTERKNSGMEKLKQKTKDESNKENTQLRNFPVGEDPNGYSTDMSLSEKGAELYVQDIYKGKFLMIGFGVKSVEEPSQIRTANGQGLKRKRRILCYQTYVFIDGERQKGFCYYPSSNKRISLAKLLSSTMQDFGEAFPHVDLSDRVVVLVGHNTVASLSALSCFKNTNKELDNIRRKLLSLDSRQCIGKTLVIKKGQPATSLMISIRDSSLLAPQGNDRIEDLGDMIGLPSTKLTRKQKSNMAEFLRDDPKLFEENAIRDVEITVKFTAGFSQVFRPMMESLGKSPYVPPTLASLTGPFVEKVWKDEGILKHDVLGMENVKECYYNKHTGLKITKPRDVLLQPVTENYPMAIESYHGGWNDCYHFGPSPVEKITDYDFAGAYMIALASLGMPSWDQLRNTTQIEDFTCGALGAARVSFQFPNSVKYPTLSVRTVDGSLMRPRKGEHAYATATEIDLARRLGAEIIIHSGFVVPCDDSVRPFEKVVERGLAMRKHCRKNNGKGCSEEKLIKELLNSIYGKIAQGLARKRVFDSRTGTHQDMPSHWLSNPYIAGFITGIIRSGIGEVINALPSKRTVYTATTDGFLTNAAEEEVEAATVGPVCQLMSDTRLRTTNNPKILEVKHQALQVLTWRRRSGVTVKGFGQSPPMAAKAGLKPPARWSDVLKGKITKHFNKEKDAQWLINKFTRRFAGQRYRMRRMAGLYEMYPANKGPNDYVEIRERVKLGMDYDFGQKPTVIGKQPLGKMEHVCFKTDPWETVQEYQRARGELAEWSRTTGIVMKTPSDVIQFMARFNISPVQGLNRSNNETPIKRCVKTFLRAYMQEKMGLSRLKDEDEHGRDNSRFLLRAILKGALIGVCTEFPNQRPAMRELLGIKVGTTFAKIHSGKKKPGEDLIDNAARKNFKVTNHGVPRTPETEHLVKTLQSLWVGRGLDESLFFTP